jgi:hypothetical protein
VIAIREHEAGSVLPVRAQPGARRAGVLGVHGGALRVAVTAPADEGRANLALVELLRDLLALRRSQLELLDGHKSRNKHFLVRGLRPAELRSRLAALLET